jgi:hypothetical protein
MLLQAGNMRNVAPYDGNPVLEYLLSFEPIGMIVGFLIAIFLIFMLIHFVTNVIPELMGQKTLVDHIEQTQKKRDLKERDVIKKREESIRIQNIQYQERNENLKNRAEVEVAMRGTTEQKWQKQIEDVFSKPPFSEFDEKTKEKLKASMKNKYKEHNQKIYDDYIKNNQHMLIDLSKHFNPKR